MTTSQTLADTIQQVRSGVFHIVFLDENDRKIGSGSAFAIKGRLVTNNHVFSAPANSRVWVSREEHLAPTDGVLLSHKEWTSRLIFGSDENNGDFAVLDMPELEQFSPHKFEMKKSDSLRMGEEVLFMGYPLDHSNVVAHRGSVSSIYKSNTVSVIQIDGSVNASNSGGPLIDLLDLKVAGIITRRATGLTSIMDQLRTAVEQNVQLLERARAPGSKVIIGGVDPVEVAKVNQIQMLQVLGEIERSANVGIGYAFSLNDLIEQLD